RAFAVDTELEIDDATAEVRAPDLPAMRLSRLSIRAQTDSRGLDVEAATAGNFWDKLKLSARIEFDDLSGRASLEVADLKPQVWLDRFVPRTDIGIAVPAASLRAQVRTDGKTSLDCSFDTNVASMEILRAGQRVRLNGIAIKGEAAAGADEITLRLSDTQLGASRLSGGELRYSQKTDEASGSAGFELDLVQAMDAVRRLLPQEDRAALELIQSVAGRVRGNSKISIGRKDWSAGIDILTSTASVQVRNLPGPASLAGVSVTVSGNAIKIDRAALSMLDADAVASATIAYGKQLQVEGAIAEARVGEKFLAWIWQIAGAPPHLALKAPIRIAAPRLAWSAKQALDVEATAGFDAGPALSIELHWTPGSLDIRRAALKDGRSDATIALRTKGRAVEGRFSGSLYSSSIESMLKSAKLPSGSASGDLRLAFDRDKPGRGTGQGNLNGEDIDLTWLLARPVKIARVDLAADGASLRIREASVIWAEQRATLHGEVRRGTAGPVIDAQIDSPGIVVDALLPPEDKSPGKTPPAREAPPGDWESRLWPLPVTGRIAVRSDFVKYGARDISPFAATLALEAQRAHLDLSQARLCGISMPLTLEATPKGLSGTIQLSAQKQPLEKTVKCLSNEGVLITGDFDLKADLSTRGKTSELARNLAGTVSAEVRDGQVRKFALLGNILSMKSVSDLLGKSGPKLDEAGFPYRRILLNGHFQEGRFVVEESAFHSSAVGLAATGWISVLDFQSRLSVLVAPLSRLDQIVRSVPIIGYVLGGTLTSVPVGVSGDIRDPRVVPLGPAAITSELKGIFTRTLKLPENIFAPPKANTEAGVPSGPQ
ncbi:MAG TPA: AsmA-like C-terminal domain-containing protein, partial [Burkholderiales bacterium]